MKRKPLFWVILLALLLCGALVCMAFADGLQRSGGAVHVTDGVLQTESGSLTYKLYTPLTATEAQKAPGVLLLHGYQNDHETCAAYAIELARRGAVVLALDEYGHGSTQIGLRERGYVDHKLSVNYGAPGSTLKDIGGPIRYRVMMNFSNLSFFDPLYSRDSQGNAITDSSCGGVDAYRLLLELANVDSGRLAVSGHSMGTWSSWSVAAAYAGSDIAPRAVVLQCGELFYPSAYDSENIHFNNVLLLQAKYDEFSYFRDYQNNVDDVLLKSDLRTQFLGTDADHAAWDTTFGSFEDGTARRMELLNTNHRLTTHNAKGLSAAMDWLHDAIGLSLDIPAREQVAMAKEWLTFAAMLLTLCAMLPLMELLLRLKPLRAAAQPLPSGDELASKGKWWRGAIISILIAGLSFPFMTQLGHGLLPLPESIFRMTIGNGFVAWYALLILVMLLTNGIARRGGTILYTARSEEFRTEAGVDKAAKVCKYLGIDGLITIGGDGTYRGALELARRGVRVVGIPATIDNDMGCTEYTIGFDTACNTAIEAIDKLRDTGQSHERVSVVEVMGRNAGHLALYTALAAGASAVLLPEKEVDLEHDVIDVIRRGCIHGRRHHIVVVAEGVGHVHEYAQTIEEETGLETRVTVLGYIQRGGAPSGRDRVSAAMMGVRAIDVLKSDASSRVIVERNGRFEDMDIEEALQMKRELDEEMFVACNRIDTSYQYHHKKTT